MNGNLEITFAELVESDWCLDCGPGAGCTHRPVGYECECAKCGGTFNPSGEERVLIDRDGNAHVEHYCTDDGDECGGFGLLIGSWS